MTETLEQQVNKTYAWLARAYKRLAELNQFDCSRMESVQIASIYQSKQDAQQDIDAALMEIDRLKLVIQARLADAQRRDPVVVIGSDGKGTVTGERAA